MYEKVKKSGSAAAPSAVVYGAARRGVPGLVTKSFAREHGYKENPMSLKLHATPYDISATGFYFSDSDEYEKKAENAENKYGEPVEEFEIQFIDGDEDEQKLFELMEVNQSNIDDYFDVLDDIEESGDDYAVLRLKILIEDMGYDFESSWEKKDELAIHGEFDSDEDAVYSIIEDLGGPTALGKETLEQYFDYAAFARDMGYNSELASTDGVYYDPQSV